MLHGPRFKIGFGMGPQPVRLLALGTNSSYLKGLCTRRVGLHWCDLQSGNLAVKPHGVDVTCYSRTLSAMQRLVILSPQAQIRTPNQQFKENPKM